MPGQTTSTITPPDVPHARSRWRQIGFVLSGCALLAIGAAVGLLAGTSLGRRSETPAAPAAPAALALPGNTWRLKYDGQEPFGKDTFLEFKEDGALDVRTVVPGGYTVGNLGSYTIVARDEVMIELKPGRTWRVASGRFAVVLAGDNVVLESRNGTDRVFLHRLTHAADDPDSQSREERRNQDHLELMSLLRQIAAKQK